MDPEIKLTYEEKKEIKENEKERSHATQARRKLATRLIKWSVWILIIGLFVSIFTGIFFGLYPAYQASKLNPIDVLRAE